MSEQNSIVPQDSTETARLNEKLAWTETLLRTLMEQAEEAVVVCDPQGVVRQANPAACRLCGRDPLGQAFDQFFPLRRMNTASLSEREDSGLTAFSPLGIRMGERVCGECVTLYRRDGEMFDARMNVTPLCSQSGQAAGCVVTLADFTQYRKVEQVLRDSQARLQFLIASVPAVLFSTPPDGDLEITFMSDTVTSHFGYKPDEFTGRPGFWLEHVHSEYRQEVQAQFARLAMENFAAAEYRFEDKAGRWRWIRDERKVARAASGTATAVVGFWLDISLRKQVEHALQASEQKYHALFENATDAIFVHDKDGRILEVNETACTRMGYSREELLKMSIPELLTPDYAARFNERNAVFFQKGRHSFESVHVRRDGQQIPVEVNLKLLELNGQRIVLSVCRDITGQRQMEQRLRESEEYYRRLIDLVPDGIMVCDAQLRVNYASANAHKLFGVPDDMDVTNTTILHWLAPEQHEFVRSQIGALLAGKLPSLPREYLFQKHDGTRFWGEIIAIPSRDSQGRLVSILTACRDVTSRKKVEEALRESELRFAVFMEQLPAGIFMENADSRGIYANSYLKELMDLQDIKGKTHQDLFSPEDAALADAEDQKVLAEGRMEVRRHITDAQGRERIIDFIKFSIRPDHGAVVLGGIAIDVTEREHIEEALRASEQKYRLLFESMRDAYVKVDANTGLLLEFNPAYRDMLGYSKEELVRLTYSDITPEKWHASEAQIVQGQILKRGYSDVYEKEYCRKDGTVFPVELRSFLLIDIDDKPFAIWGIARDITERKRAEEALRESEATAHALINGSTDFACLVDISGKFLLANQALCNLYNKRADQIIGAITFDLMLPEMRAARKAGLAEAIATRRPVHLEDWDGRFKRWFHHSLNPIPDAQNRVTRIAIFSRDITQSKQIEERLRSFNNDLQASREQLRALTGRLHSVREEERTRIAREIHDVLAQELTRLKIDLTWIKRRLGKPIPEGGHAALQEKVQDMTAITDNAITSVQKIATELRPVVLDSLGLAAAIEWQAKEFENRTDIACLVVVPGGELNLVRDHATGLFRIFQESLVNIARHAHATQVSIRLTRESAMPGDPEGAPPREALLLVVEDNGRGIKVGEYADPHSLGLIGMSERALLFNGHFEITGEPGKGTTLRVWMPLPPGAYTKEGDGSLESMAP